MINNIKTIGIDSFSLLIANKNNFKEFALKVLTKVQSSNTEIFKQEVENCKKRKGKSEDNIKQKAKDQRWFYKETAIYEYENITYS